MRALRRSTGEATTSRGGETIRSSSAAVGEPSLTGVSRIGERGGGDAARTYVGPRLAVEQVRAEFPHGVAPGRCDDDVCHRYTASKHASTER